MVGASGAVSPSRWRGPSPPWEKPGRGTENWSQGLAFRTTRIARPGPSGMAVPEGPGYWIEPGKSDFQLKVGLARIECTAGSRGRLPVACASTLDRAAALPAEPPVAPTGRSIRATADRPSPGASTAVALALTLWGESAAVISLPRDELPLAGSDPGDGIGSCARALVEPHKALPKATDRIKAFMGPRSCARGLEPTHARKNEAGVPPLVSASPQDSARASGVDSRSERPQHDHAHDDHIDPEPPEDDLLPGLELLPVHGRQWLVPAFLGQECFEFSLAVLIEISHGSVSKEVGKDGDQSVKDIAEDQGHHDRDGDGVTPHRVHVVAHQFAVV